MVCNPPQQNGNAIRLATLRMQIDKRQLILSICSYHRTRSSGLTLPKKKQAPPIRKKKIHKKSAKRNELTQVGPDDTGSMFPQNRISLYTGT